jgi:hypothetical protein
LKVRETIIRFAGAPVVVHAAMLPLLSPNPKYDKSFAKLFVFNLFVVAIVNESSEVQQPILQQETIQQPTTQQETIQQEIIQQPTTQQETKPKKPKKQTKPRKPR